MLDQSNYNSGCGFDEQIVSYLYGEIGEAEKSNFENHLKQCASCEGELGGFSSVRTSIQEWRVGEFASLSTPVFVLPHMETSHESSPSRIKSVLAFFTFSHGWLPAAGTAALAVIAIFAGLLWFSAISPGDRKVVERRQETDHEPVRAQNKDVAGGDSTDLRPSNSISEKKASDVVSLGFEPKAVAKESKKPEKPGASRVKTAEQRIASGELNSKIKKSALAKTDKNDKTAPLRINKNNVPPLLVEEDEDNSLRLSDIFEEVSLK